MANTIGTGDKTDFDETRRLLYMALIVHRTKKWELAGTLVNALKHHHAIDLPADEIADHVVGWLEDNRKAAHREWLLEQLNRITAELGG